MVEFDMPGHAASWCTGYPEICPSTTCNQPLNVANEKTFDVITGLLMEMTGGVVNKPDDPSPGIFKSNMIHLGGDEVNTACWDSTPAVAAWMKEQGYTADQAYVTNPLHPLRFFVNVRTLMGCRRPLYGIRGSPSVSSRGW